MHEVGGPSRGDRLGRDDSEVHSAIRFAVVAAVVGVGFLIMGALLVSTCSASTPRPAARPADPAGAGGPLILCAAGLWAFLRTYRVWRAEGTWWGWHGAGWFLLTLMVLTLCIGVPPIAGPVMAP